MVYKFMQLLFKSMERKVIIATPIHNGYESEWYLFTFSGWTFTIKFWWQDYILCKATPHNSNDGRQFSKILKEFLTVTFPK